MIVSELIEFLRTQRQDLPVAYRICSEQEMMQVEHIKVKALCVARPDGWIQNRRPDMPTVDYLVFPGN